MPAIEHARYTCGEVLGEGAQGLVVRVIDRERPSLPLVAKVSRGASDARDARDAHLEGEFSLLARLRVPGLVRVHDFTRDARGVPFLVEDFIEGEDPSTWVDHRPPHVVALAADLAETLAGLHDAGFIHGDVKPANVRVVRGGRAMLLDLGAAAGLRHTAVADASPLVYTEAFAAPELRGGAAPSVATDLYALGATLWACTAGAAPPASGTRTLRDHAPWLTPSIAAVVESLLAVHPADRPRSAHDVIAALGRSAPRAGWEGGARGPHVREREVRELLALEPGPTLRRVVLVTGPSGAGKSHVVREVATRALLAGRASRTLRFPLDDAALLSRLVAYLRGEDAAVPWADTRAVLVVLDDLHAAPAEVVEALDGFRCMMHAAAAPVVMVATTREAPPGAAAVALGPLSLEDFAPMARDLGVPPDDVEGLHREAAGMPGWAVASLGRVPLERDAVLARVRTLDPAARDLLALVATMGGAVPAHLVEGTACASLFIAGLLTRERELVRLTTTQLAHDVADALGSHAVADRAAELALGVDALPSATLLATGGASSPSSRRIEVLARAALEARREGSRANEIDALLALAASPAERSAKRLARLERLTRDAGTSRAHPQVLAWLEAAASVDENLAALAARRRAEERARAGDHDAATATVARALTAARAIGGAAEVGYTLATMGATRLFAADWAGADAAFAEARATLAPLRESSAHQPGREDTDGERVDREELARLEHNVGVVALYRGRIPAAIEAFEQSVTLKRALGDRAGVRACLLNLGLALARADRHDEAEQALCEATALARSLGQAAGHAWCLAARADLAVRRGRGRDAEELVAEAAAIGDAVPAAVRADLVLLRAQIALLEGDGRAALAALDTLAALDGDVRASDALVDARAHVLEARAVLAILPVDRRRAARAAVAALRRARAAGLAEVEAEAIVTLRGARRSPAVRALAPEVHEEHAMPSVSAESPYREDDACWQIIEALAHEPDPVTALLRLAALVLGDSRAERAFVAALDDGGRVVRAWGVDIDGFPIAQPVERIDAESVAAARRRGAPLYRADLSTRAGRGARLVVAASSAAVIVEHRFATAAFDHVQERSCMRWLAMAEVAVRLAGLVASTPTSATASALASDGARTSARAMADVFSTAVPRREAARDFPEILGRSPSLRRALAQLDAAIDTDLPVVVTGETGTGKELFARALHVHGQRSAHPFVTVNCAAIADALFEAELFGHARGAFTGADRARPGLLARAEGGTLLLDEIGELPLARQATLLRALETRRYRAVGSDDERAFDVRIVAATNRDLDAAVEEGSFRRDLLFRLRVLEIVVPSLRDRAGDVDLLVRHFLAKAGTRATLSPSALETLEAYAYPGNVRELLHIAQRLAAARVDHVDVAHLPRAVRLGVPAREKAAGQPRSSADEERAEAEAALRRTDGNISRAAVLLGLSRHGLKKRMLRLGLRARAGGDA
jgi:serine/threonine-protein kinase PknK